MTQTPRFWLAVEHHARGEAQHQQRAFDPVEEEETHPRTKYRGGIWFNQIGRTLSCHRLQNKRPVKAASANPDNQLLSNSYRISVFTS